MRAPFEIGGQVIAPGSRCAVELPMPHQSSYTPMSMPIRVIHGRKPGPTLFISAAIHGDEINGVEIIRELLTLKAIKRLRGTLVAAPIVNIFGFINHSRYLPDRRDLNRSFPGSPKGSLASRVAYTFRTEIVDRCSHGVDLHTGGLHRTNLPHIRANLDDDATRELAEIFGTPAIINANLRDGSLRQYAAERGMPVLLYEAGEALRFSGVAIRAGVRGILNVMRFLNMITKSAHRIRPTETITARASSWVRAPQSGIFRHAAAIGAKVDAGEEIGVVADPFGGNEQAIASPYTGIVIGRTNLPVINEGDALFHVARFSDSESVANAITAFHDEHLEGLGPGDYLDA